MATSIVATLIGERSMSIPNDPRATLRFRRLHWWILIAAIMLLLAGLLASQVAGAAIVGSWNDVAGRPGR
jgi:cytochrome b561